MGLRDYAFENAGAAKVYQVMDDGSSAIDDRGETVFEDGKFIFENAEGVGIRLSVAMPERLRGS